MTVMNLAKSDCIPIINNYATLMKNISISLIEKFYIYIVLVM